MTRNDSVITTMDRSSLVSIMMMSTSRLMPINELGPIQDANKKRRRWGRGIGSGRGKNAGWGHQKSRSTPRAFEGGQTPFYKRLPKIGFHNHGSVDMQVINLDRIQQWIDMGRLIPKSTTWITMRDLLASGIVSNVKDGIKILARGKNNLKVPIHLEVSQASEEAIKAVESIGGTITCTHFNTLALRALIKPYKFDILPRRARPPPTIMNYYLDHTKSGYLSPEIQIRNLKLFGAVTSEDLLRLEHDRFMDTKRKFVKAIKEEMNKTGGSDDGKDDIINNNI